MIRGRIVSIGVVVALLLAGLALADEMTQVIQQDLTTLGYDTGPADGEMSTKTVIAISKFQSEHGLEVTGEATPQLVGIIKASIDSPNAPTTAAAAPAAAQGRSPEELQAAQQACLQEKMAAAQASQKKKRGFGALMRAVTRTAGQIASNDVAGQVYETSQDVYDVNATAADLEMAAKDLGLTEDDVEACRNPG